MRRTSKLTGVGLLALAGFMLGGCAHSAQSDYAQHLRASIQPSAERDPVILAAFGIDTDPVTEDTVIMAQLPGDP